AASVGSTRQARRARARTPRGGWRVEAESPPGPEGRGSKALGIIHEITGVPGPVQTRAVLVGARAPNHPLRSPKYGVRPLSGAQGLRGVAIARVGRDAERRARERVDHREGIDERRGRVSGSLRERRAVLGARKERSRVEDGRQGSASFAELEAAQLARERAHARDVAALVAREVAARLEAAHESGGIAGTGRVEGLAVAGVEQREVVERALLGAGIGAKPILDDAFARAESFARALDDGHPARAAALDAPEVVVEHRLAAAGLVGPLGREDRDRLGTRRFPEA